VATPPCAQPHTMIYPDACQQLGGCLIEPRAHFGSICYLAPSDAFPNQDRFVFDEEWRRWRQDQHNVQGMSFAGSVTSVPTSSRSKNYIIHKCAAVPRRARI